MQSFQRMTLDDQKNAALSKLDECLGLLASVGLGFSTFRGCRTYS
jgi:hypothetical protein